MHGAHKHALRHGPAVAQVGLLHGVQLHDVVRQLLRERRFFTRHDHVGGKMVEHITQPLHLLDMMFGGYELVEALQLVHHRRRLALGPLLIEPPSGLVIAVGVTRPQHPCAPHHAVFLQKSPLPWQQRQRLRHAVGHERTGGVHILVGKVRVFALQTERREKRLELVDLKVGLQQADEPERVETHGAPAAELYLRTVAAQVVVKNMIVVVGIVAEERSRPHIVDKPP